MRVRPPDLNTSHQAPPCHTVASGTEFLTHEVEATNHNILALRLGHGACLKAPYHLGKEGQVLF
jgi:hypothetical protein